MHRRRRDGTGPSTHAKYNSISHPPFEISAKDAVVTVVASHRESCLQKDINADS